MSSEIFDRNVRHVARERRNEGIACHNVYLIFLDVIYACQKMTRPYPIRQTSEEGRTSCRLEFAKLFVRRPHAHGAAARQPAAAWLRAH